MSETVTKQKQHKNSKGVWVACVATKRACRYASNESSHREVNVDGQGNVVEDLKPVDQWESRWYMKPSSLFYVDKKLEALNKRLKKAGVDEQFTYTTKPYIRIDPETGLEHELVEVTLNTPTLKQQGWSFVARVDVIQTEDEETFIVAGLGKDGETDLGSKIDIKPNYCEHCGKFRHRNNTYIIKHDDGTYKQIGGNCMRGFLGVTPSFWALDPDYIEAHVKPEDDEGSSFSQATARLPVQSVISLALALSEDGQKYAGAQSAYATKDLVSNFLFNKKDREELARTHNTDDPKWNQKAKLLLDELDFSGNSDYERNMKVLLSQEHVSPKHLGYVVSSVAAYMRQKNIKRVSSAPKVKARGYVGVKGDRLKKLPVTVVSTKKVTVDGYSYYQPSQTMNIVTFQTPDGKQVKWLSVASASDDFNEGDDVIIESAIVKATQVNSYTDDEETLVKNVKAFKV